MTGLNECRVQVVFALEIGIVFSRRRRPIDDDCV